MSSTEKCHECISCKILRVDVSNKVIYETKQTLKCVVNVPEKYAEPFTQIPTKAFCVCFATPGQNKQRVNANKPRAVTQTSTTRCRCSTPHSRPERL